MVRKKNFKFSCCVGVDVGVVVVMLGIRCCCDQVKKPTSNVGKTV